MGHYKEIYERNMYRKKSKDYLLSESMLCPRL